MKQIMIILSIMALFLMAGCGPMPTVTPPPLPPGPDVITPPPMPPIDQEVTDFESCAAAGNPVMESYPMQCRHGDTTYTQEIEEPVGPPPLPPMPTEDKEKHYCTAEEKAAEICTMEYIAVCGDNGKNYGNECSACSSKEIDYYTYGECEQTEPQEPIGGQRDEHGCLGPAGYSWDEEINACIRTWELDETKREAAKIAVEYVGPKEGLTVVGVLMAECPGCFGVSLDLYQEKIAVTIDNGKAR